MLANTFRSECSISQRGDAIRLQRPDNSIIFVEESNMQRAGRFISDVLRKLKYTEEFVDKVKPTSSTRDGEVVYELRLEKEHCDLHGHLHAGMAFALVDLYTWTTACTRYDPDAPFVSLNLKARFLSPARLGDVILMDSRIVHAGRKVVYAELDILDKTTKRLLVQGSHMMFILSRPAHHAR